jgi:ATP-dependent Lon protease
VLVETKVSKTRRVEFKCTMFATCNNTKKLKAPLLSRFAVINVPEYDKERSTQITRDVLRGNPLTDYISEQGHPLPIQTSEIV